MNDGPIGDPADLTLDELARAQGRILAEIAWRAVWAEAARTAAARAEAKPWLTPPAANGTRIDRGGKVVRVANGGAA